MVDLAHPYFNRTGTAQYVNRRETGFGLDPETRARFGSVRWVDFVPELAEESRPVMGTSRMKTQNVFIRPPMMEGEIVTSRQHYAVLVGMLSSINDLILPEGATIYGTEEYEVGDPLEEDGRYVIVRNVKLVQVYGTIHFDEDRTRTTATFRKVGV